jgi:hypothetical protein
MPSKLRVVLRGTPRGTLEWTDARSGTGELLGSVPSVCLELVGEALRQPQIAEPGRWLFGLASVGLALSAMATVIAATTITPRTPNVAERRNSLLTIGPSLLRAPAAHRYRRPRG